MKAETQKYNNTTMQSGLCKQTGANGKQEKQREEKDIMKETESERECQLSESCRRSQGKVKLEQRSTLTQLQMGMCEFVCVYGAKFENRI